MIRVMIADDEMIVRFGLKTILEKDEEISVCGFAADGLEAWELCAQKKPDLILMDIRMPRCNGDVATCRIKEAFPHIKVLILTTFYDKQTVSAVLSSGADGYLLKGVNEAKLVNAIKSTLAGVNVFDTEVFNNIKIKFYSGESSVNNLTERERELLSWIANGNNNKKIAEKMFLSEGTVRNNISLLLEKLELNDRTQLAVYAVKHDLDSLPNTC
ncbi:MAG: response regulator transcription factor [Gracilibacteraceae bacterium]|nr:response regulator transcription factor [Gracilibacteraceae bacterium]